MGHDLHLLTPFRFRTVRIELQQGSWLAGAAWLARLFTKLVHLSTVWRPWILKVNPAFITLRSCRAAAGWSWWTSPCSPRLILGCFACADHLFWRNRGFDMILSPPLPKAQSPDLMTPRQDVVNGPELGNIRLFGESWLVKGPWFGLCPCVVIKSRDCALSGGGGER
jgi:hypothetical protein